MELLKSEIKRPQIAFMTDSKVAIGTAAIAGIEEKLNKLKKIFSVASFILAEHDVRAMAHLISKYAQLKLNMSNYLFKLKAGSTVTSKYAPGRQANLSAVLEAEILSLKLQLEKLDSKIFKKPLSNRHIL
jgi:hypothetical protein